MDRAYGFSTELGTGDGGKLFFSGSGLGGSAFLPRLLYGAEFKDFGGSVLELELELLDELLELDELLDDDEDDDELFDDPPSGSDLEPLEPALESLTGFRTGLLLPEHWIANAIQSLTSLIQDVPNSSDCCLVPMKNSIIAKNLKKKEQVF